MLRKQKKLGTIIGGISFDNGDQKKKENSVKTRYSDLSVASIFGCLVADLFDSRLYERGRRKVNEVEQQQQQQQQQQKKKLGWKLGKKTDRFSILVKAELLLFYFPFRK